MQIRSKCGFVIFCNRISSTRSASWTKCFNILAGKPSFFHKFHKFYIRNIQSMCLVLPLNIVIEQDKVTVRIDFQQEFFNMFKANMFCHLAGKILNSTSTFLHETRFPEYQIFCQFFLAGFTFFKWRDFSFRSQDFPFHVKLSLEMPS